MKDQDLVYQVGLTLIPNIGDLLSKQLVNYCGSAEAVFKSNHIQLEKIPGIGSVCSKSILNSDVLNEAESIIIEAQKNNTQILFYRDQNYPSRLKAIDDAPVILYYKGNANLNTQKAVAIVGTRKATAYGKKIIESMVEELTAHQPLIISGLAYGIDICAHKEALKNGLATIGVMANGLDTVYPAIHKKVTKEMIEHGGLLSENRFGTKPDAPKFPARNRIIAGMSDATIVVEAAETGGALITAEIANTYHKDVFAFPGRIDAPYSAGCNKLIKSHKANLITGIADLEYLLNWNKDDNIQPSTTKVSNLELPAEELTIIKLLINEDLTIDAISRKTQIPLNKLASKLLSLEFEGLIKALPGNRYRSKI